MKHTPQSDFGRPSRAVNSLDVPESVDKWHALTALTEARETFGINHRTLGVLRVLMTFFPDRHILAEPRSTVVFPSNRTLANRLNGMPESTLRRHLAVLVNSGLVSRVNSTNGKRFAKRVGAVVVLAYGFDLSPLARHFTQLEAQAQRAVVRKEEIAVLRSHLIERRRQLLEDNPTAAAEIAVMLRRQLGIDALTTLIAKYEPIKITEEMSGTDNQNERHIDIETNINSDSEVVPKKIDPTDIGLNTVLERCSEYQSYFPDRITRWHQLICMADRIVPMIGVDLPVFQEAKTHMGAATAATVILCMLERLTTIQNPGGYLRRLTQKAKSGAFDVVPLLNALSKPLNQSVVS